MTPPDFIPTPDQKLAKDAILTGSSVLLTGPAGTGKSALLANLRQELGSKLSICASTGIAALNVGGVTLHSWAGLGLGDRKASAIAGAISQARKKPYNNIMAARVLAIDEISMIDSRLFALTDQVFRKVRVVDEPFGGVKLLLVGDFLQLPPVVKDRPVEGRFAFNSQSWADARIQTHLLTTIIRQKDADFAAALGEIRVGKASKQTLDVLFSRLNAHDPEPEKKPIVLDCRNRDVEAFNITELAKLPGNSQTFHAADTGWPEQIEKLKRDCIAPTMLTLKVDARVMLLRNLDTENGLVNGAMGRVKSIKHGQVTVEFDCGQTVTPEPATWELKNGDDVLAARAQIPLRLAYAITIHKSQGMTLDKVSAQLGDVFEHGQAYVALSRCRTLDGLFLKSFQPNRVTADPDALRFYDSGPWVPAVKGDTTELNFLQ